MGGAFDPRLEASGVCPVRGEGYTAPPGCLGSHGEQLVGDEPWWKVDTCALSSLKV